jgi:hypothetical protein
MSLYDKVIALYPELKDTLEVFANGIIVLQNDSDEKGDFISKWEHPTLVKPTDDQLN